MVMVEEQNVDEFEEENKEVVAKEAVSREIEQARTIMRRMQDGGEIPHPELFEALTEKSNSSAAMIAVFQLQHQVDTKYGDGTLKPDLKLIEHETKDTMTPAIKLEDKKGMPHYFVSRTISLRTAASLNDDGASSSNDGWTLRYVYDNYNDELHYNLTEGCGCASKK